MAQTQQQLFKELREFIVRKDETGMRAFLFDHFSEWPQDMQLSLLAQALQTGVHAALVEKSQEYKEKSDMLFDMYAGMKQKVQDLEATAA